MVSLVDIGDIATIVTLVYNSIIVTIFPIITLISNTILVFIILKE